MMNVSRLTFTKETQEKMNKPLNHFQRGELRWKKIKELSANGKLGFARNRLDVVEMLGAVRGYNAVYTWVTSMIKKGYIMESITGFGKDGKMEYEYSVIKSPSFDASANARRAVKSREDKRKKSDVTSVATIAKPVEEPIAPIVPVETIVENSTAKVVIRYKDLSIELNDIPQSVIEGIVEKLATIAG